MGQVVFTRLSKKQSGLLPVCVRCVPLVSVVVISDGPSSGHTRPLRPNGCAPACASRTSLRGRVYQAPMSSGRGCRTLVATSGPRSSALPLRGGQGGESKPSFTPSLNAACLAVPIGVDAAL